MDDVIVRFVDMPTKIKGMTVLDEDGNYNVYINDRLSHDMRMEVYEHEMMHVKRLDHYRDIDIKVKESSGIVCQDTINVPSLVEAEKPHTNKKDARQKRIERKYRKMIEAIREEQRLFEAAYKHVPTTNFPGVFHREDY